MRPCIVGVMMNSGCTALTPCSAHSFRRDRETSKTCQVRWEFMGVMARQLLCPCIVGVHKAVKVAPQCTNMRGSVELLNGKASTRVFFFQSGSDPSK
jgi:hypothetical protein